MEAIAFEVRDVMEVMAAEAGAVQPAPAATGSDAVAGSDAADGRDQVLRADGGASVNNLLMQLQADQIQRPVERPVVSETTGLGAAFLAGLATGVWSSERELAASWRLDRRFSPGERDDEGHRRWRSAVGQTKGWAG